jgi:glycosyltransferase involved in cell wall biosynthesis
MFGQVEPAPARAQGGLGIGLALVRRLVEMHQGTVTGWSDGVGKGSQFTVRLPVAEAPHATAADAVETVPPSSGVRRVLVVDDNQDAGELLGIMLEQEGFEAVIVGDGPLRDALEVQRHDLGADDWISLPGRVEHDELVDLYRRAWVVASPSSREGWGMTLTEAAATGTPVVATRIAGHLDATLDGVTGTLVDGVGSEFRSALDVLLRDPSLRQRMGRAARDWAQGFTWTACAASAMDVLVADAMRRQ